jgi:hypothetical protein
MMRGPLMVIMVLFLAAPAFAQEGLRPGIKAPDFTLPDIHGKIISLKEAVAQGTVVIHFWKSR